MKNKIVYSLIILFLITFILSMLKIVFWIEDNRSIRNEMIKINKIVIKHGDDVDISSLSSLNSETVGWIKVSNTSIDYPFVQTKNNEYYLNRSFDKKKNKAGWIYLDYRNQFTDQNLIIYGHARVNDTMFGSLNKLFKHPNKTIMINISTNDENRVYQVFSMYHIPTTSDYLIPNFETEEAYRLFIKMISERSQLKFSTEMTGVEPILTLSTCYNNDEKTVVHAKLIKTETKDQ